MGTSLTEGSVPRQLSLSFFTWLLDSRNANDAPLKTLQWAYEECRITTSEILLISAFTALAAQQEANLQRRADLLYASLAIPDDFVSSLKCSKSSALARQHNATTIIECPPPELTSAVVDVVITYMLRRRTMQRRHLEGLDSVAFQHPVDRALMSAIRTLPVFETLLAKFVGAQARNAEIAVAGSGVLVEQKRGLAPLYKCFSEACEALDITPRPRLFVEQGPIGTRSLGIDRPSVVVSSATLSFLTRDELLFALGHELGHIKAGHLRYHALAETVRDSADLLADMTLGLSKLVEGAAITPVLSSWVRRSELTAAQ